MSSLNHPAIVTVFEVGELDGAEGTTFIAMELIEGESLRSWLSRPQGRLRILELLAFVAEGLAMFLVRQRSMRLVLAVAMLMDLVPMGLYALHMTRALGR